jgi:serine/threonine protein kinase
VQRAEDGALARERRAIGRPQGRHARGICGAENGRSSVTRQLREQLEGRDVDTRADIHAFGAARAISALDHPHICTLYDVCREGGVSFLVMQLLGGETLADRLARASKPSSNPGMPSAGGEVTLATVSRGPIPFDTAMKSAIEIAQALDTAHHRGIVHRDLKPGNIMLTKTGTKLLDFSRAQTVRGNQFHRIATSAFTNGRPRRTLPDWSTLTLTRELSGIRTPRSTDMCSSAVLGTSIASPG